MFQWLAVPTGTPSRFGPLDEALESLAAQWPPNSLPFRTAAGLDIYRRGISRRRTPGFSTPMASSRNGSKREQRRRGNDQAGCEGGRRLLNFEVRWKAAVCAGGADGFLCVFFCLTEDVRGARTLRTRS